MASDPGRANRSMDTAAAIVVGMAIASAWTARPWPSQCQCASPRANPKPRPQPIALASSAVPQPRRTPRRRSAAEVVTIAIARASVTRATTPAVEAASSVAEMVAITNPLHMPVRRRRTG